MPEIDEKLQTQPSASAESSSTDFDLRMRRIIVWIVLSCVLLMTVFQCGFIVYHLIWGATTEGNWLLKLFEAHYPATAGTPYSAMAAFAIVTILKVTDGTIEFEALGFKFRGASGPIVLWLMCFLAFSAAFGFLWSRPVN